MSRQLGLDHIIGRPGLEGFDRHFLAESARHEDEGQIGAGLECELQRGDAVERRKAVIREDQVEPTILQSAYELGAGLHANDVAKDAVRLENILSKLRVGGAVLEQQDMQRRLRDHFFLAIISSCCRAAAG